MICKICIDVIVEATPPREGAAHVERLHGVGDTEFPCIARDRLIGDPDRREDLGPVAHYSEHYPLADINLVFRETDELWHDGYSSQAAVEFLRYTYYNGAFQSEKIATQFADRFNRRPTADEWQRGFGGKLLEPNHLFDVNAEEGEQS